MRLRRATSSVIWTSYAIEGPAGRRPEIDPGSMEARKPRERGAVPAPKEYPDELRERAVRTGVRDPRADRGAAWSVGAVVQRLGINSETCGTGYSRPSWMPAAGPVQYRYTSALTSSVPPSSGLRSKYAAVMWRPNRGPYEMTQFVPPLAPLYQDATRPTLCWPSPGSKGALVVRRPGQGAARRTRCALPPATSRPPGRRSHRGLPPGYAGRRAPQMCPCEARTRTRRRSRRRITQLLQVPWLAPPVT